MGLAYELEETAAGVFARARILGLKRLNLVDEAVLTRASEEFAALLEQHPEVRCVTVRGQSQQAFVGGADLKKLAALREDTAEPFIQSVHGLCDAFRLARVPVIAVMQGYCLGAGLEIAAACDIRIGDRSVKTGMPEVRVGVPSVVEAALIPGLIGWGKANELLLRGHIIDAEESFAIGILQHLVDETALGATELEIIGDIVAGAPCALAAQKRLHARWQDSSMTEAIAAGVVAFRESYRTREPADYTARFFKK
ncbi:MAG: enoyl-CoA hydratase-related protein [Pseudomonadota bacterium]